MLRFLATLLAAALIATACGSSSEDSTSSDATTSVTGDRPDVGGTDTGGTDAGSIDASGEDSPESTTASPEAGDSFALDEGDGDLTTGAAEGESSESEVRIDERPVAPPVQPEPGTLTAAEVDDNLNIEFFGTYLDRIRKDYGQRLPTVDLDNRIRLEVVGSDGTVAGNARLDLTTETQTAVAYTSSAGVAYLFPGFLGLDPSTPIEISVTPADGSAVEQFTIAAADSEQGPSQTVSLGSATGSMPRALDVALVLDVTGSMSDELRFLTVEFDSIIARLADDYPNVDMRFSLVAYRDVGDAFVTRVFDFTGSVEEIRNHLSAQDADGGGDFPEAMDQALADANELSWRTGNVARVLILNADAPPHDNRFSATVNEAKALGRKGVRIYPLAASGVDDSAEYIMRAMAASTGGRHMFLTNDSGVGGDHQEPKTECYVVTKLDDLILRVLGTELAGERIEASDNQIVRTSGNYNNGVCI